MDLCDRFGLPLVVLVDTPGFLPGATQEHAGVIRHGASLLRAFGTATRPRVTLTLRQAYGGAHIVMNSRDLGADLTLAWPHARIGVMGARQAVEIVNRREIAAGADADALADAYEAEHLPVRVAAAGGARRRGHRPRRHARAHRLVAGGCATMTPAAAAARSRSRRATRPRRRSSRRRARRSTRRSSSALTMDVIAKRAFVSRTAVYFYFHNKRAVVDRLIQQAFHDMYDAAAPYLDGEGDAAARAAHRAGARRRGGQPQRGTAPARRAAVGRTGRRTCRRSGRRTSRFTDRAEARIARDQERGIAPADIPPRLGAQALLAMVESHITARSCSAAATPQSIRVLAELWWRAVYSRP